jgi:hypothetical protein
VCGFVARRARQGRSSRRCERAGLRPLSPDGFPATGEQRPCAAPGGAGRAAGCFLRKNAAFNARAARPRRVRRHLTSRPFVGEGTGVWGGASPIAPHAHRTPDTGQRHKRERKPDLQMQPFHQPRPTPDSLDAASEDDTIPRIDWETRHSTQIKSRRLKPAQTSCRERD